MQCVPLLVVLVTSVSTLPVPLLDPGSRSIAEPEKILPSATGSDPDKSAPSLPRLSDTVLASSGSVADQSVQSLDSAPVAAAVFPHSIESSGSRVKRAIAEPNTEKDAAPEHLEIVVPPQPSDEAETENSLESVIAHFPPPSLEIAAETNKLPDIDVLPTDEPANANSVAPESTPSDDATLEPVNAAVQNETDASSDATLDLVSAIVVNDTSAVFNETDVSPDATLDLVTAIVSNETAAAYNETDNSDATFELVTAIASNETTVAYNETDASPDATFDLVTAIVANETTAAPPVTTPASELGIRHFLPFLPDLIDSIPVANSSFDSFWKHSKTNFANNTARVMDELTRAPFERNVVSSVDGQAVDARLRKRVEEMAAQFDEGSLAAGPGRNVEEIYVLAATYFCSDCSTVYSLEAVFNVTEASHNDHRSAENEFGNITSAYTCGAFHRVSGVRLVRHQKGRSDVELDMTKINEVLSGMTSQFGVGRSDRQASWKKPSDNITLIPTYNAGRLPEFGAYSKIRALLNEVVSLKKVRRLHNRCSHFASAEHDDHFFSSVCYEGEQDTDRSFYASSESGEDEDDWSHSMIDLKEVIHELIDVQGSSGADVPPTAVCETTHIKESTFSIQSSLFAMSKDTPSFWEIDEGRSRVFRQQYLSPESIDGSHRGYSRYYAKAHDRADLFIKRAKVAVVQEHLTDRDEYNRKVRAYLDCDQYDNREYNEYASWSWWKKYLNPYNWFTKWRNDCGAKELEAERKKLMREA